MSTVVLDAGALAACGSGSGSGAAFELVLRAVNTGALLLPLALAAVDGVTSLLAVVAKTADAPFGVAVSCFWAVVAAGFIFGAGFCAVAGVVTAITATSALLLALRALLCAVVCGFGCCFC